MIEYEQMFPDPYLDRNIVKCDTCKKLLRFRESEVFNHSTYCKPCLTKKLGIVTLINIKKKEGY